MLFVVCCLDMEECKKGVKEREEGKGGEISRGVKWGKGRN